MRFPDIRNNMNYEWLNLFVSTQSLRKLSYVDGLRYFQNKMYTTWISYPSIYHNNDPYNDERKATSVWVIDSLDKPMSQMQLGVDIDTSFFLKNVNYDLPYSLPPDTEIIRVQDFNNHPKYMMRPDTRIGFEVKVGCGSVCTSSEVVLTDTSCCHFIGFGNMEMEQWMGLL